MANLQSYHQKRDFEKTNEPRGTSNKSASKHLSFVVQRHHASRLHYDFRLELDGVLKSWAIPKGPSMNPLDKRLAVHVEDHPLDYAHFEGTIPKGNYGAGTVSIFDSGYYEFVADKNEDDFLKSLKQGSIKFRLHGNHLKGEFALVKMKQATEDQWLLIKHADSFATDEPYDVEQFIQEEVVQRGKSFKRGKAPVEASKGELKPMLAKLSNELPDGTDWLYEKKYDGFRAIAICEDGRCSLYSRNGHRLDQKFPTLIRELKRLSRRCIIDGEIVLVDRQGKEYFQGLQAGEPIAKALQLRYYVFDILELDDINLRTYTLVERKELLELLLKKAKLKHVFYVQSIDLAKGAGVEQAAAHQWEGIIAKQVDSQYLEGQRSSSWLKYKLRNSQEAVICGFTETQGQQPGFGALVLGAYAQGKLVYIGNCGSGFKDSDRKEIGDLLAPHRRKSKPFKPTVKVAKESQVHWVEPELVCEVYFAEWTADKHLRHPVFKGLRADKGAKEASLELVAVKPMESSREVHLGRKKVTLTNQDKIYWPHEGIRKGDMLAFYEQIGTYLLPYVKDKPISMHRFPNGIKGKSFFQKDVDPKQLPTWMKTVPIESTSNKETIDYLLCNDMASLLYIANLGSIEINSWLSSFKKTQNPKFAVLDLDPNGMDFQELKEVAKTCRKVLEKAEIPGFIKTSGSSGFHIFLHMNEKYEYKLVRDFVQFIAQLVHDQHPETTSLERAVKQREGLIYLDFLQNRQGQTIAAPYSVRPKPGASVSTPIFWDELDADIQISDFTIDSLPERLQTMADPWDPIFKTSVDIKRAIKKF